MSEHMTITHERTDAMPVILAFLRPRHVAALLDKHFPTHGHGTGLRLGQMLRVWLPCILSQGDPGSRTLSLGSPRLNRRSVAVCTHRSCHAMALMLGWRGGAMPWAW